jgi:thiamine biosynthesis lipoprotein
MYSAFEPITVELPTNRTEFRAMGCGMAATVVSARLGAATERLARVRDLMEKIEACLSRFRPNSELSQLNARAGHAVKVSPLLWETLSIALTWAWRTDGLYDPTILDALEAAGYDRSFDQGLDDDAPAFCAAQPASTWRDIVLDAERQTVMLPPGVRIDLGGVAKGWAADRASDLLVDLGPCLVDAGGDLAARGAQPPYDAWPLSIADPFDDDKDLLLVMVRNRGLATSGLDYRHWRRGGTEQHHLIDPRTRRPAATDLISVSVIASTAEQADVYAKLGLLLGLEAGTDYLTRQPGVEALLVSANGLQRRTPGFERYVYPD